jgi:hypothetical protein
MLCPSCEFRSFFQAIGDPSIAAVCFSSTDRVPANSNAVYSNWNCVNSSSKCVSSCLPSAITNPFRAFRPRLGSLARRKCVFSIWKGHPSGKKGDESRQNGRDSLKFRLPSRLKRHKTNRKSRSARKKCVSSNWNCLPTRSKCVSSIWKTLPFRWICGFSSFPGVDSKAAALPAAT